MVPCNCSKCNGKIVDVRTKLNHEADRDSDDDQDSEVVQDYSNPLPSSFEDYSNPLPSSSEDYGNPLPEDNPVSSDKDSDNNQNVIQRMEIEEIDDLSTDLLHRQRSRRYANQQATITEEKIPPELFITDEESSETDEESNETDEESNESEINNGNNNDYEYTEIFENYAPPVMSNFKIELVQTQMPIDNFSTEALIQFIKLLLIEIGSSNFEEFSGSLYLARNEVEEFQQNGNLTVMKCSHVEFPNSTFRRLKQCQTPLAKRSTLLHSRIKIQSEKIFPFASIRNQLASMYCQPGFERNLRHWSERK
uniref:Uncharacterized protein n=1 Tax=Rhizophagus irregularis (strain DAOM 181602 / DAOM 197198 / MUCL 43194) TaxID=747089 RepID=U9UHM1_RHIID